MLDSGKRDEKSHSVPTLARDLMGARNKAAGGSRVMSVQLLVVKTKGYGHPAKSKKAS